VQRVLSRHLLEQAGLKAGEGDCGSVTLIQRFGSAANLNIHLHCLVLDGVYRTNAEGEPEFVETPAPSDEQVWEVLERIIKRVMKQLARRNILVEDQGEMYLADADDDSEEARVLRPLHRGSCALPNCLRSSGRSEGADVARRSAQRNKWQAEVMRQPARLQPTGG
jgi:Putative transposase